MSATVTSLCERRTKLEQLEHDNARLIGEAAMAQARYFRLWEAYDSQRRMISRLLKENEELKRGGR